MDALRWSLARWLPIMIIIPHLTADLHPANEDHLNQPPESGGWLGLNRQRASQQVQQLKEKVQGEAESEALSPIASTSNQDRLQGPSGNAESRQLSEQISDDEFISRWFEAQKTAGNPAARLSNPVNIPIALNNEDSAKLDQLAHELASSGQAQPGEHAKLNLGTMNDRQGIKQQPYQARAYNINPPANLITFNHPPTQYLQPQTKLRPGQALKVSDRQEESSARKGKVDNEGFERSDTLANRSAPKFKHLALKSHQPLIASLPPGCITSAAPATAECEDHLIKRLYQDDSEGRTVRDVSRRVCCALFWHKDCVSRKVLEWCPDSNPAAADVLLGSRNLDLTLSCRHFNRQGCNSAPKSLETHDPLITILLCCAFIINYLLVTSR